jgi:hypothetical protein
MEEDSLEAWKWLAHPTLGIKKKLRILHGADIYMPFHLP